MLLLEFVSPLAELEKEAPTPTILVAAARDGTVVVFEPDRFPAYQLFKTDNRGSSVPDPAPLDLTCMAYTHDRTMFAAGTKAGGLRLSPGLPVRATLFLPLLLLLPLSSSRHSLFPFPPPSPSSSLSLSTLSFFSPPTIPPSFCYPLSISNHQARSTQSAFYPAAEDTLSRANAHPRLLMCNIPMRCSMLTLYVHVDTRSQGLDILTNNGKFAFKDKDKVQYFHLYAAARRTQKVNELKYVGFAAEQFPQIQQMVSAGEDPNEARAIVGAAARKAKESRDVTLSTSSVQSKDAQIFDYYFEDAAGNAASQGGNSAPHTPAHDEAQHSYDDVFYSPQRPSQPPSSPRSPTGIADHNLDTSHESAPWFITNCIDDVSAVVSAAVKQSKLGDYLVRYSSDNKRVVVCFNDHGQEAKLQFEPAEGGCCLGDFQYQKIVDGLVVLMTKPIPFNSVAEKGVRVLLGKHANITKVLKPELAEIVDKEIGPDWHRSAPSLPSACSHAQELNGCVVAQAPVPAGGWLWGRLLRCLQRLFSSVVQVRQMPDVHIAADRWLVHLVSHQHRHVGPRPAHEWRLRVSRCDAAPCRYIGGLGRGVALPVHKFEGNTVLGRQQARDRFLQGSPLPRAQLHRKQVSVSVLLPAPRSGAAPEHGLDGWDPWATHGGVRMASVSGRTGIREWLPSRAASATQRA